MKPWLTFLLALYSLFRNELDADEVEPCRVDILNGDEVKSCRVDILNGDEVKSCRVDILNGDEVNPCIVRPCLVNINKLKIKKLDVMSWDLNSITSHVIGPKPSGIMCLVIFIRKFYLIWLFAQLTIFEVFLKKMFHLTKTKITF